QSPRGERSRRVGDDPGGGGDLRRRGRCLEAVRRSAGRGAADCVARARGDRSASLGKLADDVLGQGEDEGGALVGGPSGWLAGFLGGDEVDVAVEGQLALPAQALADLGGAGEPVP